MAAVGEGQNSDEFHCTLCIKDSGGPYSHESNTRLRRIAAEQDITLKTDIYPYYSSDATAYWRAGGAARAALIGPGVDSSHSYERTHTDALRDSARLHRGVFAAMIRPSWRVMSIRCEPLQLLVIVG